MLDEYAYYFFIYQISDATFMAWLIGLFLLGFTLALRMRRNSHWAQRRVPNFLAYAGSLVAFFAWVRLIVPLADYYLGSLSLPVLLVFLGMGVFGYVYGIVSHARSVSGYGHGGRSWMALVPFANLFLMFKSPIQKDETKSGTRMASNLLGIALGLFLLVVAQGINKFGDVVLNSIPNGITERAVADAMPKEQDSVTKISRMAEEIRFHEAAEQGNAAAQFNLGVVYRKGQGVIQDMVYAHMWLNIAASNGIKGTGASNRDVVAKNMTESQIAEAQKLARECVQKNYKGC